MKRKTFIMSIALFLAVGACTHIYEVPRDAVINTPSPTSRSVDAVALVLTPELRSARWEESKMGDKFIVELGDPLEHYSRELLESMFGKVYVVSSAMHSQGVRFYIVPTMKRVEHTSAAWAFGDQVFTMALEWRILDQSGSVALLDTVVGEARGRQGNVFTDSGDREEVLRQLMVDTFTKSRARLAPLLRTT